MSLHSKTHPLFLYYINGTYTHCSIQACFLYFSYIPFYLLFFSLDPSTSYSHPLYPVSLSQQTHGLSNPPLERNRLHCMATPSRRLTSIELFSLEDMVVVGDGAMTLIYWTWRHGYESYCVYSTLYCISVMCIYRKRVGESPLYKNCYR